MGLFIQGATKITQNNGRVDGGAVPDRQLNANSTNAIANDVVTGAISDKLHYKDVTVSATASSWTNTPTDIDTSKYDVIGCSFNYTDNYYTATANGKEPSLSYNRTTNNIVVYNGYSSAIALSVRVIYTSK